MRPLTILLPTIALLVLCADAGAQLQHGADAGRGPAPPIGPAREVWAFDETTTGEDVHWTSPTSVGPSAQTYLMDLEITAVEIHVEFLSIPFGPIDVIETLTPEELMASGPFPGPAPVTILDFVVDAPGPPDPTAVGFDLSFGLDPTGFGFFDMEDVVLGVLLVDIGPPFGSVPTTITSLRIAGVASVGATSWSYEDGPPSLGAVLPAVPASIADGTAPGTGERRTRRTFDASKILPPSRRPPQAAVGAAIVHPFLSLRPTMRPGSVHVDR